METLNEEMNLKTQAETADEIQLNLVDSILGNGDTYI